MHTYTKIHTLMYMCTCKLLCFLCLFVYLVDRSSLSSLTHLTADNLAVRQTRKASYSANQQTSWHLVRKRHSPTSYFVKIFSACVCVCIWECTQTQLNHTKYQRVRLHTRACSLVLKGSALKVASCWNHIVYENTLRGFPSYKAKLGLHAFEIKCM